jgi:predicted DNA-binding transcriptional regulator AlpA
MRNLLTASIPEPAPAAHDRLITANDLCDRLGISRRTLGERLKEGSLPEPLRLRGRLYWRESAIAEFIRTLGA